jgi:predicted membrane channel-forming protein YqfA (hemolysin III family)
MLSDFAGLGVLAAVLGCFIYTQVPPHWQSLRGFLLIVFGWLPLAILTICVIKTPEIMIPVLIVALVFIVARNRA